jgi:methyl-accepting chemotaxis protein
MFNRENKNRQAEKVLTLLNELENYIENEKNIFTIDKTAVKDAQLKKIYDKVATIAQKLEAKTKEDQGVTGEMLLVLEKISDGNLSGRVHLKTSNPHIQYLATSLNKLSEKLQKDFSEMALVLKEYEQSIYKRSLDESTLRDGEMLTLIKGINSLKNATTVMLRKNFTHGMELEKSSEVLIDKMFHILEASGEQSKVLQSASAEITLITQKAKQSDTNTQDMQSSSAKVKSSAYQGLEYVNETAKAIDEINNATININEAIDVIDQIAFQTNILSLNAAVEAATAGEAGKGFAVVASEVRNLAARSADAAKTIKELVIQATDRAVEGKKISEYMTKGYQELNVDIENTIRLIEDTTKSVHEQVQSIDTLEKTLTVLDKHTQNYISIAHSANEVSSNVSEVSKNIFKMASVTEFDGKDKIAQNYEKKEEITYV